MFKELNTDIFVIYILYSCISSVVLGQGHWKTFIKLVQLVRQDKRLLVPNLNFKLKQGPTRYKLGPSLAPPPLPCHY